MDHATLPALLGYDRSLLLCLKESEQRQIERVAEAWLLSSVLLACPLGYAAWLIEHSLLLTLLLTAGVLFVVLNMLRLSIAGGGVSAGAAQKDATQYTPALGASVVIGMLALLFAQPAQLPLWRTELEPVVEAHRAALIADHERSLSAANEASDPYREALAHCDFVVLRLKTIWRTPTRALQFSAFYVLVVLLPALWARFIALSAVRAYALARWRRDRRLIADAYRESARECATWLARFPSYTPGPSPFADAPFDTRVASALLVPALQKPGPAKERSFRRWLKQRTGSKA